MHERMDFGGQGQGKQPREKIRGSQFVKREEKTRAKLVIRNPFIPKERPFQIPQQLPKKPN